MRASLVKKEHPIKESTPTSFSFSSSCSCSRSGFSSVQQLCSSCRPQSTKTKIASSFFVLNHLQLKGLELQRILWNVPDTATLESAGQCQHYSPVKNLPHRNQQCNESVDTKFKWFCSMHQRQHSGLEIKTSLIPNAGNGLFVVTPMSKGDTLDIYHGIYTSNRIGFTSEQKVKGEEKHYNSYVLETPWYWIDARDERCSMARYANGSTSSIAPNAAFQFLNVNPSITSTDKVNCNASTLPPPLVSIVALRDLVAGEEVIVFYGPHHTFV